MPTGIGYGSDISNLGGIAGQRGLSTGEPLRSEPAQQPQNQQLETPAVGESEPPLTEDLGQNVNYDA